ncbi:hypothetical protein [Galactobacter caseinivorans]|uniref:Uncharacterized protein n=1 Tax=Galactobacter caseinivorans TaxID=2676123 RepID=A0A496PMJ3_9MICC|nr:hypothetical protein [Galactobacter caseinivorans]RKW71763.1 hypothetical protein DWQ67_02745 [Galactobacter caseinivorans]
MTLTQSCTATDCGRPTSLYLCAEHLVELDSYLVDRDWLWVNLDPYMQATKTLPKGNPESSTVGKSDSRPPLSLEAAILRTKLAELPARAYDAATDDPHAGNTLRKAKLWIESARHQVWGPAEDRPSDTAEARARIAAEGVEPMPTRQLVPWMRQFASLAVKGKDIRNWAFNGWIVRRNPGEDGHPTYDPCDVLRAKDRAREGLARKATIR